jgi:hypothetical protein
MAWSIHTKTIDNENQRLGHIRTKEASPPPSKGLMGAYFAAAASPTNCKSRNISFFANATSDAKLIDFVGIIHAGDLAIDDGTLAAEVLAPLRKVFEVPERVPVAGYEIAMSVVERQGASKPSIFSSKM